VTGLIWSVMLNGGLAAAAYGVARDGLRQPPGLTRWLAAAVVGWAWLTVGVETLGTLGLLARWPLLGWVGIGLAASAACRFTLGPGPAARPDRPGVGRDVWVWERVAAVGLVLWAAAVHGAWSLWFPVKVISDGPIYHLYFAARWWKSGRLDLVATPFGENAATYFPAGGDLWFAWLTVGWGGELLAKVGQAPFWALAGLASYATARRLGAGGAASAVASGWFVCSTPFFIFGFEPNVDAVFGAGYLLAAYFFLRHALGDDGPAGLALGALAAGGALGSKAPAFLFVGPLLALGAASGVARGRGVAARLGGAAVALGLPFAVSGFWFVRNARLTGNPLYPLHLEAFGRVWLAGWYGPGVMRLSSYYLPASDWRSGLDIALLALDPRLAPFWLAAAVGAWRWGALRRPLDRWVWLAAGLAALNVGLFWGLIPYRTQQRFALHALGLAAAPLARLLDRSRALAAAGVGLLGLHLFTSHSWPFPQGAGGEPPWDLSPVIPNGLPGLLTLPLDPASLGTLTTLLGVGLGAGATAWFWGRRDADAGAGRGETALLATAVFAAATLALLYPWGADARRLFYPYFPDYARGWLEFDLRAGPGGATVAYAGTDLPYYLLGTGLRNEVRYVNVDAHPDWLLHDYHREATGDRGRPATWDHPRPGWDRARPDYDAWLANLRRAGARLLVVTRTKPSEGPHNVADAGGFTVERVWADAHPEAFVPLYGVAERDPEFRLYRIKPVRP